jgi:hypothetical protein
MTKTVKDYIRTIVDFPHEGILFRDVTTLFADPRGFRMSVDQLLAPYAGLRIDKVAGLEARGFILGGAVAHQLSSRGGGFGGRLNLPARGIGLRLGAAGLPSPRDTLLAPHVTFTPLKSPPVTRRRGKLLILHSGTFRRGTFRRG